MNIQSEKGIQFSGGMPQYRPSMRSPLDPSVKLAVTDSRHIQIGTASAAPAIASAGASFGDLLTKAIGDVDAVDAKARDLSSRSVYDPDSVEVHDVMIAAEKSRFALNMTKTVADGLVRTFRELTSQR
ncbi:MAG: flagellar hook-basal body complex protein FliE [Spirochaetia bacterium]|nr:flagellar hook-basal body complex protein FliE [Spirochaetia bacterium]